MVLAHALHWGSCPRLACRHRSTRYQHSQLPIAFGRGPHKGQQSGSIRSAGLHVEASASADSSGASTSSASRPKAALITGGNTGIGFQTALALSRQGYYTVIGCRDMDKGKAAKARILHLVPGAKVEVLPLDLANLAQVRDIGKKAQDIGQPLDVLVNNAGVMATPPMQTADGYELQLGVNHLGHFLLTSLLLPLLTQPDRPSRIVNVSSDAHRIGKMQFDDLMSTRNYQPWKAYGQSKLANVLFTYELARRLPSAANLTVNTLHPGVVNTDLARYLYPSDAPFFIKGAQRVMSLFLKTPEQGAATSIYLASSPQVEGVTAKYFSDCKPRESSKASYSVEDARRLWDVSCELTRAEVPIFTFA